MSSTQATWKGFAVHAADGKELRLAMQELYLTGQILPVGARVVLRHVFRSSERRPLEAVYAFALPRDSALRRFRIEGPGFSTHSELQEVEKAQELYERGIEQGHLSSLARQYGDGLVNLAVGNIRPDEEISVFLEMVAGVESLDDGFRFRFPFTLAPSYHSRARAIEVEPGVGEMQLPEDRFGDLLLPPFHRNAENLHRIGFDLTVVMPSASAEISSPSHTIKLGTGRNNAFRVSLGRESDLPNRDLVLEASHYEPAPLILTGRSGAQGQVAAVIPSPAFGTPADRPTRIALVLDRSGSMEGPTIEQAKSALKACLGALSAEDSFGIVAFDNRTELLAASLLKATTENRKAAQDFLSGIEARGGTELEEALLAAGSLFTESGADILVVTDGQVFETERISKTAADLGHRVHILGIGCASQDRFLSLLARGTGGISRFQTPRERIDLAAVNLFSAIGHPVAGELTCESTGQQVVRLAISPPAGVFSGTPLVLLGDTDGPGTGLVRVSWREPVPGSLAIEFVVPEASDETGETLRLLRGARLITDLDSQWIPDTGKVGRRQEQRIHDRMIRLSRAYGLASRATALVAVTERAGDRTGELPHTHVVPVAMPEDTPFAACFPPLDALMAFGDASFPPTSSHSPTVSLLSCLRVGNAGSSGKMRRVFSEATHLEMAGELEELRTPSILLIRIAALLEPDGGMPGDTLEERVAASLAALLCFAAEGSTRQRGTYQKHVRRVLGFIDGLDTGQLSESLRGLVKRTLEVVHGNRLEWADCEGCAVSLATGEGIEQEALRRLLP